MRFSVSPTSVITRHTPHAYSAFPEDMPAEQTKSVITLDLWFNRLWQHWKVVNEIAFFICISVFTNKSNPEHACCTVPLNKTKLPCSYSAFSNGTTLLVSESDGRELCPKGKRCPVSGFVTVKGSLAG